MKRECLINYREKKKWSQEVMANFLEIPQTTYSCYELGVRNPKVAEAKRMAKKLQIKWTKFYDEPKKEDGE